jgi:hypothetical protein
VLMKRRVSTHDPPGPMIFASYLAIKKTALGKLPMVNYLDESSNGQFGRCT